MGRTRKKIVALLVSILVFSSSSHAFAYLQPDIDWGAVETFTYEYEYDMFENSLMVKFLQYWLSNACKLLDLISFLHLHILE